MIAVGEYVGNISEMDSWCNNVQTGPALLILISEAG